MKKKLVIIGAGMAAGRLVEHVSEMSSAGEAAGQSESCDWEITLFNAEPRGTYNRIMLSPVLSGEKTYEEIVTHDAAWYEAHGVTCRFGERDVFAPLALGKVTRAEQVTAGDLELGRELLGREGLLLAGQRLGQHFRLIVERRD